ncbi:MAG TPA: hypothetical protein VFV38_33160, partial [Ktedonobacteraceae bacterium]|nr:hypothetical protein [Ktedonobacteraceae bacterium]
MISWEPGFLGRVARGSPRGSRKRLWFETPPGPTRRSWRGFSRFPQGGYLITLSQSSVPIQIVPESRPSTPSWLGEVTAFAQVLSHTGILQKIQDQVRFARARFGHYDLIDFVVVLIGYVVSGEPTLLAFYERLAPFAEPFMALFGRNQLPHRSTLSRFLAALDQPTVEALRTLFQKDE